MSLNKQVFVFTLNFERDNLAEFKEQIDLINQEFSALDDFNSLPLESKGKLENLVEELNTKYLTMVQLFQAEEQKNMQLQQEHEELKQILDSEMTQHAQVIQNAKTEFQNFYNNEISQKDNEQVKQILILIYVLKSMKKYVAQFQAQIQSETGDVEDKTQQLDELEQEISQAKSDIALNEGQIHTLQKNITGKKKNFEKFTQLTVKDEDNLLGNNQRSQNIYFIVYQQQCHKLNKQMALLKKKMVMKKEEAQKLHQKLKRTNKQIKIQEKNAITQNEKLVAFQEIQQKLQEQNNLKTEQLREVRTKNKQMQQAQEDLQELEERLRLEEEIYETQELEHQVLNQHLKELSAVQELITQRSSLVPTPQKNYEEQGNNQYDDYNENTVEQIESEYVEMQAQQHQENIALINVQNVLQEEKNSTSQNQSSQLETSMNALESKYLNLIKKINKSKQTIGVGDQQAMFNDPSMQNQEYAPQYEQELE